MTDFVDKNLPEKALTQGCSIINMNLADSTLFKDYARPILQPEASVNKAQGHSSPGIMSSVLQCLVCPPKLEVSRIKLAYVSEE